jgi:hypothetical protein
MRLLVCGGRDYADEPFLFRVLDAIHRKHGIEALCEGEMTGADMLSAKWGKARGMPVAPGWRPRPEYGRLGWLPIPSKAGRWGTIDHGWRRWVKAHRMTSLPEQLICNHLARRADHPRWYHD